MNGYENSEVDGIIVMFRRIFLRMMRMITAVAILLSIILIAGCLILTQPGFNRNVTSTLRVSPEKLEKHVVQFSETFHPRNYEHTENLDQCVEYIKTHFEKAGARVEIQKFEVRGFDYPYKNVIARFGGNSKNYGNSKDSKGPIVVGAHYDSFWLTPGADDNASGVAGLIELAYLIGSNEESLKSPLELVAYCLEEPPFFASPDMGSAHHANYLKAIKLEPAAVIVLEMIGSFSEERNSQKYPLPLLRIYYPGTGSFIAVVGCMGQGTFTRQVKNAMQGTTSLPVYSINAPRALPGIDLSDHRCYWDAGWNAVMITDTAFLRNPHYHQLTDTAEKLDYIRMSQVIVATFEAVKSMSNNP